MAAAELTQLIERKTKQSQHRLGDRGWIPAAHRTQFVSSRVEALIQRSSTFVALSTSTCAGSLMPFKKADPSLQEAEMFYRIRSTCFTPHIQPADSGGTDGFRGSPAEAKCSELTVVGHPAVCGIS